MKIHSLTMSDYEQIVALWRRAGLPFKPNGRDSREAIRIQMEINPDFFLGAFEGGNLVGVVIASCEGRKGWINRLAVDPNFRRRGIATALIADAEKVIRKRGTRIFCAQIEGLNNESTDLFKSCGYIEYRDVVYFSKRDSDQV